jgi:hypothetical protein
MREFFRSVLGLFKSPPTGVNCNPEPGGDGSNQRPDGSQDEVAFRVPGMS